jgi:hypothetical protein
LTATDARVATIGGARIIVVAIDNRTSLAAAIDTCVVGRATGAVVTRAGARFEGAADRRVAGIEGAAFAVVATQLGAADADTADADIVGRANILVVTGRAVVELDAALGGVAVGVDAGVVAFGAGDGFARDTLAGAALALAGTGIAVVAGVVVRQGDAARDRIAMLGRARIVVVAAGRRSGLALAVAAHIVGRAGVAVVAGTIDGCMNAARAAVAAIVGAGVGVIAAKGRAGKTGTV